MPAAAASPLESLLRRDRLVVIAALGAVIVACWAYILAGAGHVRVRDDRHRASGAHGGDRWRRLRDERRRDGDRDMPGMAMGGGASDAMDDMARDAMPAMTTGEGESGAMRDMAMAAMAPMAWTPGYAALMLFMWWTMMMAMMLPTHADDPPVRHATAAAGERRPLRAHRRLRRRLRASLGGLQPGGGRRAVGPGAEWPPVLDDGEHQRDPRRAGR